MTALTKTQPAIEGEIRRRLRRALITRRVAGLVVLGLPVVWLLLLAFTQATDHGPERGMAVLPVLVYGIFASPLLLIPIVVYFVASHRRHSLEWRLMFSSSDVGHDRNA